MFGAHYDTLTLFCRGCEHAWAVDVLEHADLAAIRPEGTLTKPD